MRLVTILLALFAGAMLPDMAAAQDGSKGASKAEPSTDTSKGAAKSEAAPTRKAAPKPNPIASAYAAMPAADRIAIQADLIWTGDFNGVPSADFGDRAVAAVKAFQARNGGKETGLLSAPERAALAASAKAKQNTVGWRIVDDPVTTARLGIPLKLAPTFVGNRDGTRWTSPRGEVQIETFRIAEPDTTLAAVFDRQKKEPAGRTVAYSVLRPDFFVISGLQGLKKYYVRAQVKGNEVRGVMVLYDQAMEGTMSNVVIAISGAYQGFPIGVLAGPPPKRKVDYGTGIVVNDGGYVLADRQVTDGCYVITIPGLGGVDVVAEDKTADLALLRVYGARDLVPIALGNTASTDATLVGIADPQAQGGGGAASNVRVRVGDNRAVEPAPALGFSGAAAVDAQGRLVGMVQLKPSLVAGPAPAAAQAVMVPSETIAAFLKAQNIEPSTAVRPGAEAKRSVLRVICARR